jgi:hypothetical protein
VGWKLNDADRDALLREFKPRYARVVAHHVTFAAQVDAKAPLPKPVTAAVAGLADDGAGVQALVVEIDGSTERPDGGTYHITWSLAHGRKAAESNVAIKALGWTRVPQRPVKVEPMKARMSS